MLYNYFRDYDPGIGRYSESDPLGLIAGPNTYDYANQSPLRYSDVDGLSPIDGDHIANALVGMGDGIIAGMSLGMISGDDIRGAAGVGGTFDRCSLGYEIGKGTGGLLGTLGYPKLLFGKAGLLNRGPNLRIGLGRNGSDRVIRIAGNHVDKVFGKKKIDLLTLGKL